MKNKYIGISKVGEKGQIVIPKEAREMFGIKPGDSLVILCDKKKGMAILKSDVIESNIDDIIKIIKESESDVLAKQRLIEKYRFSEIQADAILELKLRRLTGLEREKIEEELANILKLIEEYKSILASEQKVLEIIKNEMLEIKEKYVHK